MDKKEKVRIYNSIVNDEKAISHISDLELIENAIINKVAMYVKGYHKAEHIKLHLDKGSEGEKGEISLKELLNLGKSIRKYNKLFEEPFIDNKGDKVYEWQDILGTRFRSVIANSSNEIIFYSDRNFKEKMQFKNPKVVEAYAYIEKLAIKSERQLKTMLDTLERDISILRVEQTKLETKIKKKIKKEYFVKNALMEKWLMEKLRQRMERENQQLQKPLKNHLMRGNYNEKSNF